MKNDSVVKQSGAHRGLQWWAVSASAIAGLVACAPAARESADLNTTALSGTPDAGETLCLEEEEGTPLDGYDAGVPVDDPPQAPLDAGATSVDPPPPPPPTIDAGAPLSEAPPPSPSTDGGVMLFPADRPRPPPPPPKCPPKPPPPPICKAGDTRSDASECHWTYDYSKQPPPRLCSGRVRNEVCRADYRGRTSWELTSFGTCSTTQCNRGQ